MKLIVMAFYLHKRNNGIFKSNHKRFFYLIVEKNN